MMYQNFINYPTAMPTSWFSMGPWLLAIFVIWEIIWKGYGLWKAARNNETWWFVAILLLNTIGILPILYIYVFAKDRKK